MSTRENKGESKFRIGGILLVTGLVLGILLGIYIRAAMTPEHDSKAGNWFLSGLGTGFGASIGLVVMIIVLKFCDRKLAAEDAASSDSR